ncbi:MAG: hypothetical protein HC850_11400, partial [Rhodomicrobium sp.]|nr:hypothetical protein [Rhodomicrobium sp.]
MPSGGKIIQSGGQILIRMPAGGGITLPPVGVGDNLARLGRLGLAQLAAALSWSGAELEVAKLQGQIANYVTLWDMQMASSGLGYLDIKPETLAESWTPDQKSRFIVSVANLYDALQSNQITAEQFRRSAGSLYQIIANENNNNPVSGPPVPIYQPPASVPPAPTYNSQQLTQRVLEFLPRSGLNNPVSYGQNGDQALADVANWNRAYTTPAVAFNITYWDPYTKQQATGWVAYFGVNPASISNLIRNIDATNAFNINNQADILANSGLSDRGLATRIRQLQNNVFAASLPTISAQPGNAQQMVPVFDPSNYNPFKTTIAGNNYANIARNNIDNLDLIIPADYGLSAFIQGVSRGIVVSLLNYWNNSGLLRNGVNLDGVIAANGLSDLIEVVNGQARLKPAPTGTSTNQPANNDASPEAPTYPFPDIDNPWTTPEDAGAVEEPYPQVRDPWEDEPEADAGGGGVEQPPRLPPTGGNGNNGNEPPEGPGGGQPAQPARFVADPTDLAAVIGNAGGNLALGVANWVYNEGVETRTSQPLTTDNVLKELAKLQQSPDNYIKDNYNNSAIFGLVQGDTMYNFNGHLMSVEQKGEISYFRDVPEDMFNQLRALQQASGIVSGKVYINETVNGVPVWVEIRPPARVEGQRFSFSPIEPRTGSNVFDDFDASLGGALTYEYGNYSFETGIQLGFDPRTRDPNIRLRAVLPFGSDFHLRAQDATTYASASAYFQSEINGARVTDLTNPDNPLNGATLTVFNNSLFAVSELRQAHEIGTRTNGLRALRLTGTVKAGYQSTPIAITGSDTIPDAALNYEHAYIKIERDGTVTLNSGGASWR